jgi:hypothetical protein
MTFHEIIDSLIDVSEVPEAKRIGKGYEDAIASIHLELSTLEDVEIACYHEAGHWSSAIASADQLQADGSLFEVTGPRIKYFPPANGRAESFDATPTGLQMVGMEDWKAESGEDVEVMARIAVSGGESVLRFYGPTAKRGDANDRMRFDVFCRETRLRLGSVIDPPHLYWDQAIIDVRPNFNDTIFALGVLQKAELIKRRQFGPVFGFHT